MSGKTNSLPINDSTYSFNRGITPFPEQSKEKIKPPVSSSTTFNNNSLLVNKVLTEADQLQKLHDSYKKAVRAVMVNLYTGGNAYRKGYLDAIYKGAAKGKPAQKA